MWWIFKLIMTIILIAWVSSGTCRLFDIYNNQVHTFSGHKQFNTIEEATNFQNDVILKAKELKAEVRATITVHSPPTIGFTIYSPTLNNSPYGENFDHIIIPITGSVFLWFINILVLFWLWRVKFGTTEVHNEKAP